MEAPGIEPGTSGSVAKNSGHLKTSAINTEKHKHEERDTSQYSENQSLLLHGREVLGSNLSSETDYPDSGFFLVFLSS
jgi:hypothetical protein